jgi:hypothetical protein
MVLWCSLRSCVRPDRRRTQRAQDEAAVINPIPCTISVRGSACRAVATDAPRLEMHLYPRSVQSISSLAAGSTLLALAFTNIGKFPWQFDDSTDVKLQPSLSPWLTVGCAVEVLKWNSTLPCCSAKMGRVCFVPHLFWSDRFHGRQTYTPMSSALTITPQSKLHF